MNALSAENNRLRQLSQEEHKMRVQIEEYENKLTLISLEIERLHNSVKSKTQELNEV